MSASPRHGFTLIELSIVLVIIGLIVGGVLVGRDLIQSSEIRAQIKQIEEFKTAVNTFKTKYGYLPGDMPPTQASQLGFFTFTGTYAGKTYLKFINATWGSLRFGFGDNSGDIDAGGSGGEQDAFWQHLSEAKMINGTYGGSVSLGNYLQPSTSTLAAGYPTGGIPINYPATPQEWDIFRPQSKLKATDNHVIVDANLLETKLKTFSTSPLLNYFMLSATANQVAIIDNKLDDGIPNNGAIREGNTGFGGSAGGCTTGALPVDVYDLTPDTANILDICYLAMLW